MDYLPSLISLLRVAVLPMLAYSFFFGFTFLTYALFLIAISTDLADGYIARRQRVISEFGAYFDSAIDLIFILGMFGSFFLAGIYPWWLLPVILFIYLQFVVTNITCKISYDPVGKYYGSLLYGAIGLTLLFPGDLLYNIVIAGVVFVTVISLLSRLTYYIWSRNRKGINS